MLDFAQVQIILVISVRGFGRPTNQKLGPLLYSIWKFLSKLILLRKKLRGFGLEFICNYPSLKIEIQLFLDKEIHGEGGPTLRWGAWTTTSKWICIYIGWDDREARRIDHTRKHENAISYLRTLAQRLNWKCKWNFTSTYYGPKSTQRKQTHRQKPNQVWFTTAKSRVIASA